MSENESKLDLTTWLSQVDSTPFSDPSPSTNRKRKRLGHRDISNKHTRPSRATTRPVLAQLQHNAISPQPSPVTMSPKKRQHSQVSVPLTHSVSWFKSDWSKTSAEPLTPNTSSHKGSTRTRSTASVPKLANNVHNVRRSLEDNGLYFQDTAYGERFADFKQSIETMVFRKRGSVMKPESIQKITNERAKNATTGELSYFRKLKPLFIKDDRLVETKKRNFAEEIVYRSKAWADDGLDDKSDVPFVRGYCSKISREPKPN